MGPRVNERIRVREVRVIDEAGVQLGLMSPREALDIARERGFDLIEVAPDANPPVCRIQDYGKYRFEQGKREREAAKKQRQSEMKGMTLRPGTDDHDLEFKIKNIVKFLADGDKVKVTVRFKSRELAHPEFARRALDKIVEVMQAESVGVVERPAMIEGKQMIMILAPSGTGTAAKKPVAPAKPAAPKPVASTTAQPAPLSNGSEAAGNDTASGTSATNGEAPAALPATEPVAQSATPEPVVAETSPES